MARDHARIQIDIWNDEDFRNLTSSAQLLYLQLLSSATLTYAGVADWRSKRLAILSRGRTPTEVETAMVELESGMFAVVDEDTEEVFIRSFFKWDGLLMKPNVAKAMIREWGNVHSLDLKAVIVHELKKLREQFPEWRAFSSGVVDNLLSKRSLDPLEMVQRRISGRVPETLPERDASLPTPYSLLPAPDSGTPELTALSSKELESVFDQAYSSWPKKVERKQAFERFKRICKKRDPHELAADIVRFGDAYVTAGTETRFVPGLGVWLNGERWTDDLPQRQAQQSSSSQQPSKADEANDFISRLEAIDAVSGGGEAARDYPQLRQ